MTRRMDAARRIAVVEPRCHGLEHVPFNAALIATTLAAYPDAVVDVYGEGAHLKELGQLLASTRGSTARRLFWYPVEIPARRAIGWNRAWSTQRLFAALDRALRERPPSSLVVATTDPFILTLLKVRLHTRWAGRPTVAVVHELLAVLGRRRQSSRRWGFAACLALPHPRGMTYLVLAKSILEQLEHVAPRTAARAVSIELPSLLGDLQDGGSDSRHASYVTGPAPRESEPRGNPPLRFGFVGGGRDAKGFQAFLEVVGAVRQDRPDVHFEVVGSAPADIPRSALTHLTWSDGMLPLAEFVQKLGALSYVIWLGDPKHYELVASGTLADTIALGVPVICLSGPLVDHVFEQLGDIGIKCDTLSDVQREVLHIATNFPTERYRHHRQAAYAAAARLAPEAFAPVLRQALTLR